MRQVALIGLVAVVLALAGCGGGDDKTFQIDLSGADIYALTVDSGEVTRLTDNAAEDYGPVWSPDDEKIAFTSTRDGNSRIYVMDADGENEARAGTGNANDWEPTWSPDGTRIAFVSDRDGNPELYVMDADGTDVQRLTDSAGSDWEPAWKPSGKTLLFSSNRDGDFDIFSLEVPDPPAAAPAQEEEEEEETPTYPEATRLTDDTHNNTHPCWSPTGSTVGYFSSQSGGTLWFMSAAGASKRQASPGAWPHSGLSWSINDKVVYAREIRPGSPVLWAVSPKGNSRLTAPKPTDKQADGHPAWSSDEEVLLFTRWTRAETPY